MRLYAKNLDTLVLVVVVGVHIGDIALAGRSGEKPSRETSRSSQKSPTIETSETSAVIQTVEAPAATTRVEKFEIPSSPSGAASSSGLAPVSFNEIIAPRSTPELVPISYEFAYGTPSHSHVQNKQPDGIIKGRYVIHAPDGQHRTVDYVADKGGFRAGVATNEPGTETALEGASRMVSSAMTGVDAALKFGPRHHSKDVKTEKPVQTPANIVPKAEPVPPVVSEIRHHHVQAQPQTNQQAAPLQLTSATETHHYEPLRIVDIQPLPAPLVRYTRFERPPPPPSFQVIPSQSSSHYVPRSVVTAHPQTTQFSEPLPSSTGNNAVATVVKPVTLLPPQTTDSRITVVNVPSQFASSAQVVPHFATRFELIPAQPDYLHRPFVHTVSEISRPSQTHVLSPGQHQILPPISIQISQLRPQYPDRVITHPAPAIPQPLAPAQVSQPAPIPSTVTPVAPVQQLVTPSPVPVGTIAKNIVHYGPVHMQRHSQVFEVKTKVVPAGGPPPPMPLPPPITDNVVILPQHNSRHVLGQPKPQHGGFNTVRIGEFVAGRPRLPHPEEVLKNLPPPINRPPPPVGPARFPEPVVFLAVPPKSKSGYAHRKPEPHRPSFGNNESIRKFFGDSPSASDHDIAVDRFFSNIKQHHINEVKMVKKHEEQLQAVASNVMPFFGVGPFPPMV